jgi:hypothetical protein
MVYESGTDTFYRNFFVRIKRSAKAPPRVLFFSKKSGSAK